MVSILFGDAVPLDFLLLEISAEYVRDAAVLFGVEFLDSDVRQLGAAAEWGLVFAVADRLCRGVSV